MLLERSRASFEGREVTVLRRNFTTTDGQTTQRPAGKRRCAIGDMATMLFRTENGAAIKATLLLTLGVLVCLTALHSPGTGDRVDFLNYMEVGRQKGILAAYPNAGYVDYPPLVFMLLGALAHLADVLHLTDFITLKISLMVFTLACAGVAANLSTESRLELAVIMFLTLVVSSMLETYIDVYSVLFLLAAVYLFKNGRHSSGAVCFAIASLIKWQPIILGPLVLLYLVPRRPTAADLFKVLPAALLTLAVFLFYHDTMIESFVRGYQNARLSGQAVNFNWLITGFIERHDALHDGVVSTLSYDGNSYLSKYSDVAPVPAGHVTQILLGASSALRYVCYFVALFSYYKSDRDLEGLIRASIVCFMCYFVFGYGVHESHACVPAVLGVCWFAVDRRRLPEAVMLAGLFNLNMILFYGFDGEGLRFSRVMLGVDVTLVFAAFALVLFFELWVPVANNAWLKIFEPRNLGISAHGKQP